MSYSEAEISQTTIDAICRGVLLLEQRRKGYRFNVDSVILADFVVRQRPHPPQRVADLGAGTGIIGLLLAKWWPQSEVKLIEIQPNLATLAKNNAHRNGVQDRVEVIQTDLRSASLWASRPIDFIVSNPPFFKVGCGQASPNPEIAIAKHEQMCALGELITAFDEALEVGGEIAVIHQAARSQELRGELRSRSFHIHCWRDICSLPDSQPSRSLCFAVKGDCLKGERTLSPLIVRFNPDEYSPEMKAILRE